MLSEKFYPNTLLNRSNSQPPIDVTMNIGI